jgi:hypothetical protein
MDNKMHMHTTENSWFMHMRLFFAPLQTHADTNRTEMATDSCTQLDLLRPMTGVSLGTTVLGVTAPVVAFAAEQVV